MSKTRMLLSSAFLILMISLPALADTPGKLAESWSMVPKAGQRAEFFEGLKEHMAFRSEAGDPFVWETYTPMLGDELNTVVVRACCFDWADVDAYREWSENNAEVNAHWQEHVGQYADDYGHYFTRLNWSDSNVGGDWSGYRYFAVTEFETKAGMAGQFDAAREALSQIAINNGWANEERPWVWSSSIANPGNESIVVPHKRLGDMDRDEQSFFNFLVKVMGSEEAAEELLGRFGNAVAGQEFQIWERHADYSMKAAD
ncbi:MAG: hypothetical protein V2I79_04050 [Xanthomonadales bacterium]|jgi:hypothetical protein|nr:hypothetical protein [Xanthomonadales bacterium]